MNNWLRIVQHFLARCLPIPQYCLICFRSTPAHRCICQKCEWKLPKLGQQCQHCGFLLKRSCCMRCRSQAPSYSQLLALFPYEWPLNVFIGKMKFQAKLYFAQYFASLMLTKFKPKHQIDAIIPIPLHPHKQQKRGFNQNIEIAKILSHRLKIPLDRRSCTKIKDTVSQGTLSAKERCKNIKPEMFKINRLKAKHVLVIEDVVTTGTTVQAFVAALKAHGVVTVEIWCCCLARGPN